MELKNIRFKTNPFTGDATDIVEVTMEMTAEELRKYFKIDIEFIKKRFENKE